MYRLDRIRTINQSMPKLYSPHFESRDVVYFASQVHSKSCLALSVSSQESLHQNTSLLQRFGQREAVSRETGLLHWGLLHIAFRRLVVASTSEIGIIA